MNNFDFNTFSVNLQITTGIFLNIVALLIIFIVYRSNKEQRHKSSK